MTTSGFDPEISNANLNAAQYYIDDDGALKFVSPYISSSNFDGTIPVVETTINAENIEPGMLLQVDAGEYLPVISVSYDDVDLESSPSSTITIGYVDSSNELNTIDYNFTDSVDVRYEDWANKDLGNQGWSITSGGNAIFANVGIRGDLEATTLDVGGTSGITYDGSTVTIGASVIVNAPITFNGVTEATLSASLAGYIPDGGAASDVNSNFTTISGGKIRTGILESTGYSGGTDGTAFSTTGMAVNLDNGSITAKSFRIDTGGNAVFSGSVVARGGYFGNSSYGMGIVDDGSTVTIRSTTLRMGSQNVSGTLHGSIDFYTTGGLSIGQISSAASNKTWSGLGDGIVLGTTSDYFFLPRSGNTTRSRYYGSGFEWYNTSGQTIMSIAGGTGGLRINTGGGLTGNGITSSNANIEVTGTGKFVGDGSGLTNLPGGGGGGVTEIKFGDNQLWRSGRVYISSGSVVSAIDPGAIGNGKLANSTIQIMSTTKSLGQSFVAGDIDGDVLTANSVAPGKIANTLNLFSLGGTGVARGNTVSTITGPLTIGTPATGNSLTVNGGFNNGLSVPTARGLDYTMNLGTSLVNLNRAATAITLSGVTVDGISSNTSLFTLGTTAITAGNTFSTISGGITLNGGPTLGGGPTLQTGTNGFVTVTIGSGGTFRVNTLPLNLSGATSFVRYNPSTGAVAYTTTTSALKYKNIVEQGVDLSDDSWLDNINIVKFKYKLEEEKFLEDAPVRIGLIADEISNLPIFNEIVERDSVTGEVDSIQYDKLALYLIPIIKELKNKINSLEERLDAAGL